MTNKLFCEKLCNSPFIRQHWLSFLFNVLCVQATVVYNLETYGIDVEYFASTVQKGVACSVTVGPRPAKPKELQVMVQGNQIHYIGQLLRGISVWTVCY